MKKMKKIFYFQIIIVSILLSVETRINAQNPDLPIELKHCENGTMSLVFPLIESAPINGNNVTNPAYQYWFDYFLSQNAPNPNIEVFFGSCDTRNSNAIPSFASSNSAGGIGAGFQYTLRLNSLPIDLCLGNTSYFAINLPEIGWIVYEYGLRCTSCPLPECEAELEDCTDWLNECEDYLSDFLVRNEIQGNGCEQWAGECGIESTITRKGTVIIGTEVHPGLGSQISLGVKGGILTSKIKITPYNEEPGWGNIENSNSNEWWCDYVFEDNYNLMSLLDLEKFIANNKHLPRTPSAAEIKENGGYEVGSVLFNHQEKVEEIFLHMIDLDKQITEMKQELKKK